MWNVERERGEREANGYWIDKKLAQGCNKTWIMELMASGHCDRAFPFFFQIRNRLPHQPQSSRLLNIFILFHFVFVSTVGEGNEVSYSNSSKSIPWSALCYKPLLHPLIRTNRTKSLSYFSNPVFGVDKLLCSHPPVQQLISSDSPIPMWFWFYAQIDLNINRIDIYAF